MTVVALPERPQVVRIVFDSGQKLSNEAYRAFCESNPDLRVERNTQGEIVIVPPAGSESSHRSLDVASQLFAWAKKDGCGKAFDSSVQFLLPDGSALSPDAAWVSNESLARCSRQQRKGFLPLAPEFVVEVMSPSDRLKQAKTKMEQWVANGVQLAWLIDGDAETIHIYRTNHAPKTRQGIQQLAGAGPIQGFVIQLRSIWAGLG
jgi:Uma2 family endonuclease